jgi:hypothetical protein
VLTKASAADFDTGWETPAAGGGNGGYQAFVWWDQAPSASSAAWSRNPQTAARYLGFVASDTTNGSWAQWEFAAPAGTYSFEIVHYKGSSHGIIALAVDGVTLGTTIDLYGSVLTNSNITTITGVTLANGAAHTLRFTVTGKNPASSNYSVFIQGIRIYGIGA